MNPGHPFGHVGAALAALSGGSIAAKAAPTGVCCGKIGCGAKRSQKGFTLLELLIGMVLLGLILTLLFGGLRLGARSWDSGDKRADDTAQLRAIHGFLRRELSQVFPLRWKNEVDTRLAFAGIPDALKFVAPLPVQVSGGGLYLLGLELERGEEGSRLIMKRVQSNPAAKDFTSLEQGEKSVLVDHIEKMNISYFGATTPESESLWQEKWDDPQRLPLLVRIQIKLSDGRDWPDLVVPLIVEKGCIWDSFHKRCVN
jgi:general secretion pathway protein J